MGRYRGQQHPIYGRDSTFAKVFRLFGIRSDDAPPKRQGNMASLHPRKEAAAIRRRRRIVRRSRRINAGGRAGRYDR